MRAFLAAALFFVTSIPAGAATCVASFPGEICADGTVGAIPSANASVTPILVPGVSLGAESAAALPVLMLVFEGPNEAIAYWHFLIPTVEGQLVFYEAGVRGTYSGICTNVPGIGACVAYAV